MNDNDNFDDYYPYPQDKQTEAEQEDEYKVGYQKPPKEHQFQRGQSGNPKGRPKKSKNFKSIIQDELYSYKEFRVNGKKIKAPLLSLVFKKLSEQSLKGDISSARLILQYAEKHGPEEIGGFDDIVNLIH